MRIGILTSGGDCPGINATIRGVCKTAINHYGMEVYGIHSGFRGLLDNDITPLTDKDLTGLLSMGGTILGTSREKPFKKRSSSSQNKPALILKNIQEMQLDCIVCIGGNGTQKTAAKLAQLGVNIVSIPKTIDNDVWGTDTSFGFDTSVTIATEAIDRLHSTASSHQRVIVIEVMGHKAGWIALHSGMAGGGDIILIPELEYNIRNIGNTIIERLKRGKTYSIVVVAEGIKTADGKFFGIGGFRTGDELMRQNDVALCRVDRRIFKHDADGIGIAFDGLLRIKAPHLGGLQEGQQMDLHRAEFVLRADGGHTAVIDRGQVYPRLFHQPPAEGQPLRAVVVAADDVHGPHFRQPGEKIVEELHCLGRGHGFVVDITCDNYPVRLFFSCKTISRLFCW